VFVATSAAFAQSATALDLQVASIKPVLASSKFAINVEWTPDEETASHYLTHLHLTF
jgi:hypothetical protein